MHRVVSSNAAAVIEVRVERIAQLFDALDASPYPRKDLAPAIEEFIVDWARELPRSQPVRIVVHLPADETASGAARQLSAQFSNFFRYRIDRLAFELRELFRIGRWSLLIGMVVFAGCLVVGQFLASWFDEGYLHRFFNEGLIILGWVANWRPVEIFLYGWWPLVRRQKLYRRLAVAAVEIKPWTHEQLESDLHEGGEAIVSRQNPPDGT